MNLATQVNYHFVANRSLKLVHSKANASFARWNAHYAKPNPLKKRIGVNNHRKDVSNPKSIPADLHLRNLGTHSIYMQNLH